MSNIRKILLIDDDTDMRETLAEQIALYEEFEVLSADCSMAAITAVKANTIDLAIMDVGLPDMDGREAIKIMRENGFKSPIIMLIGNDTDADTGFGLDSRANDYVTKPFRFAILLTKIRAHLRQYEGSEDAIFQLGSYSFRPSAKLLITTNGEKLRLTEKETAILHYLYRAGDKIIGRDVLLQEVWGYNSNVTTHTLETHIYRLRQKIEPDPAVAKLLITELGGYRLVF
jgi:DNA-binding response OmpR family regulator